VWLSPRDAVHLVQCCIDAPEYHFITVYGVSDNARSKYRNVGLEFLGYRPQDKAEDYSADIMRAPDTEDAISRQFHGGMYTPMGFRRRHRADRVARPRPPCAWRRAGPCPGRSDAGWSASFARAPAA
jgi:hypothetical protein